MLLGVLQQWQCDRQTESVRQQATNLVGLLQQQFVKLFLHSFDSFLLL